MIENLVKKISWARPKNKAGLDIGSYAIKIVEISQGPEKATLVGLGSRKVRGLPKEALADSIKALAEEALVSAKDLNISVSGPSVIVRLISMPKMTSEDLKGAIRFEAEKFIPFDI
ncbi:MAG: pilus assembly protein PilM [Candidatus Omnitrophica bacterium]|nr:pilus assembly protein PilM [Candidatus Omnitrophota bacterium]